MAWLLLAGIAFVLVLLFARRRRRLFIVSPSDVISTAHVEMWRRQSAKKRAALAAATAALR
jgi:hypothetical protein